MPTFDFEDDQGRVVGSKDYEYEPSKEELTRDRLIAIGGPQGWYQSGRQMAREGLEAGGAAAGRVIGALAGAGAEGAPGIPEQVGGAFGRGAGHLIPPTLGGAAATAAMAVANPASLLGRLAVPVGAAGGQYAIDRATGHPEAGMEALITGATGVAGEGMYQLGRAALRNVAEFGISAADEAALRASLRSARTGGPLIPEEMSLVNALRGKGGTDTAEVIAQRGIAETLEAVTAPVSSAASTRAVTSVWPAQRGGPGGLAAHPNPELDAFRAARSAERGFIPGERVTYPYVTVPQDIAEALNIPTAVPIDQALAVLVKPKEQLRVASAAGTAAQKPDLRRAAAGLETAIQESMAPYPEARQILEAWRADYKQIMALRDAAKRVPMFDQGRVDFEAFQTPMVDANTGRVTSVLQRLQEAGIDPHVITRGGRLGQHDVTYGPMRVPIVGQIPGTSFRTFAGRNPISPLPAGVPSLTGILGVREAMNMTPELQEYLRNRGQ